MDMFTENSQRNMAHAHEVDTRPSPSSLSKAGDEAIPLHVAPRLGDSVQRFTKRLAIDPAVLEGLTELIAVLIRQLRSVIIL